MDAYLEAFMAVLPWIAFVAFGTMTAAWWESTKEAPEDDPLGPARGCVGGVLIVLTVASLAAILIIIGG